MQGRSLPVLLSSLVGLDLRMIMVDVLHFVDQGVMSHCAAHIFIGCGKLMGPTQTVQLEKLNAGLLSWYEGQKDTYRLQGEIIRDRLMSSSGFPELKGKVASARHLSGYFWSIFVLGTILARSTILAGWPSLH